MAPRPPCLKIRCGTAQQIAFDSIEQHGLPSPYSQVLSGEVGHVDRRPAQRQPGGTQKRVPVLQHRSFSVTS